MGQKSILKAEEKAYDGEGESQETQQVLSGYMLRYGVGFTSSSPAPDERPRDLPRPQLPFQHEPGNKQKVSARYVGSKLPGKLRQTRQDAIDLRQPSPALKDTASGALQQIGAGQYDIPRAEPLKDKAVKSSPVFYVNDDAPPTLANETRAGPVDLPNPLIKADILPHLSPSSALPAQKMDLSQSPTQSNDGRSYDRYFDRTGPVESDRLPSTDPGNEGQGFTQSTSHEHITLNEDDTGAVNFGLGNPDGYESRFSAPGHSCDVDFENLPPFPSHSQDDSQKYHTLKSFPETPAPPKNPFSAGNHAPLFGGSQLFKQTQFSSAVRRVSPTSSRPSPNDFPDNSISPNPVISSPLKTRGMRSSPLTGQTSSPQVLPGTSSRPQYERSTPFHSESTKDRLIPESPHLESRHKNEAAGPMEEYESMKKSQERREASELRSESTGPVDESEDDDDYRRRRARSKKEAAARQLSSINLERPSTTEDVQVPFTNKKGRKPRAAAEEYSTQCHGPMDDSRGQETVANSQDQVTRPPEEVPKDDMEIDEAEDKYGHDKAFRPETKSSSTQLPQKSDEAPQLSSHHDMYAGDAIPETSPTDGRQKLFSEFHNQSSSGSSKLLSIPNIMTDPPRGSSLRHQNNSPRSSNVVLPPTSRNASSEESDQHGSDAISGRHAENQEGIPDLPRLRQPRPRGSNRHERSSPPALSTRSRRKAQSSSDRRKGVSRQAPPSSATVGSTSTLTNLTATPNLSNKTTPATEDSGGSASSTKATAGNQSSPAVSKIRRRSAQESLHRLKTAPVDAKTSARLARQQTHQTSSSTDELTHSPTSTPTFEHSLRMSRTSASRLGRTSVKTQPAEREHSLRGARVFEGMAFAISFQSKKSGESVDQYNDRMEHAKLIQKKIQQAGGKVLSNGFDELFEKPSIKSAANSPSTPSQSGSDLHLLPTAATTGFTALIADGHSRKVKYMQALALGLPCIATRWITTCLEKDKLVDWSPYLLCAGQSSFLGDAIRSRNLISYDASEAKLADVVEERSRLLEGSNILLVMKKSEEAKRMAYVFLAHVLGATLSRAYSVEEAKPKLKAMEDLGQPYDWVLIDEKTDKGDLFTPAVPEGKKRKRVSGANTGPAPKKIRTLSDELVIQSLILGRLIEDGEMED